MSDAPATGPVSAGPFFDLLAGVVRVAVGAVLALLVLLVCTEALLRGFASISLGFAEELSGYFIVMLTLFGAALALRTGGLFEVRFVFDALPLRLRPTVFRVFIAVSVGVCAILAWKCTDLVLSSFNRGKFAPTVLETPLWIPELLLPVGFVVIAVFLVEQFLLAGRRLGKAV